MSTMQIKLPVTLFSPTSIQVQFDVCLTFLRTVQKIHNSLSSPCFQSKTKWMTVALMLISLPIQAHCFVCFHRGSIWIPLNPPPPPPSPILLMSDLSAAGIYSNAKRWHPLWLLLFVFWCPGQLHCSKQQSTHLFCALLVTSWSERHKAWVEQTDFLFSLFTSMSLHNIPAIPTRYLIADQESLCSNAKII